MGLSAIVGTVVLVLVGLVILRQVVFGGTPVVHHPPPQATSTACTGAPVPAGELAFTLDAQQSEASYQAHFQAAGQALPGTVTGVTGYVSGGFVLRPATALTLQSLKIVVDLRTLDSGAAERDDHVRTDTFQTATYPFATFAVLTPEVLQGQFTIGQTIAFDLPGHLNVHGITHLVMFAMHATMSAQQVISGSGTTQIDLRDYQMKPPQTTSVVPITISNHILLQIQFRAVEVACLPSS
jgi:polyisoprenoid-binding protein YceI